MKIALYLLLSLAEKSISQNAVSNNCQRQNAK